MASHLASLSNRGLKQLRNDLTNVKNRIQLQSRFGQLSVLAVGSALFVPYSSCFMAFQRQIIWLSHTSRNINRYLTMFIFFHVGLVRLSIEGLFFQAKTLNYLQNITVGVSQIWLYVLVISSFGIFEGKIERSMPAGWVSSTNSDITLWFLF